MFNDFISLAKNLIDQHYSYATRINLNHRVIQLFCQGDCNDLLFTCWRSAKGWHCVIAFIDLTIQQIVSKGDLQARIERWLKSSPQENNNNQTKINNIQRHLRPNLANEYVAPSNEIESAIAGIGQEVLGIDQ